MSSKYVQVYSALKKQIERGEYGVGQLIPPEGELMQEYMVSRDTVRKALGMLENQGYIQKSRGKAAVVVEKKDYNFPFAEIASFKELNENLGRRTETEVENLEILTDKKQIMAVFGDDREKEIYELLRIRKIEGERVIIDHDYFKKKRGDEPSSQGLQGFCLCIPGKRTGNSHWLCLQRNIRGDSK